MPIDATETYLDLRGLKCPLPVLRTQKLLNKLRRGDLVVVECTDPLSVIDIPHLVRTRGDTLERNLERDGVYVFHIRRQEEVNGRR
jgi:tRNA 2-thiouridine synthesizing protein A